MATDDAPLLYQRGIGKVATYYGKREDFEEWIFPFESYCSLLGWDKYMIAARDAIEPIVMLALNGEAEKAGRSLEHLLVSTTKGTALSVVKLTERGNGFEAMRCSSRSSGRS